MTGPVLLILAIVVRLFAWFCLLRFLLQFVGANFYSPIANAIQRLTDPVLQPMRKFLPASRKIDLASLLSTLILNIAAAYLLLLSEGRLEGFPVWAIVWNGAIATIHNVIWLYMITILFTVIMSWVAPNVYSPAAELARQLSEPYLALFRKFLPPLAGFDFSPMVAIFILITINSYLIPLLRFAPT